MRSKAHAGVLSLKAAVEWKFVEIRNPLVPFSGLFP
jgi:hypothetical protein